MRRVGLHKAIGNVARIDHAIAQTLPCMRIDVTLSMRVVTMALLLMLRVVSIAGGVACTTHHLIRAQVRSEEHTSELQSLMRISYAVFCLKKKIHQLTNTYEAEHTT